MNCVEKGSMFDTFWELFIVNTMKLLQRCRFLRRSPVLF